MVIFLGRGTAADGSRTVRFWSSNMPDGYGTKEVSESEVRWVIFSRLLDPSRVERLPLPDSKDKNLADMLSRSFTRDEVRRMIGMNERIVHRDSSGVSGPTSGSAVVVKPPASDLPSPPAEIPQR